ncbi:hypothetical protein N7461_000228 [Penicillium sp. DV-2018c]|nr:hypothetical protein N7461_000228 [Penicillium sp. DV-2018c]
MLHDALKGLLVELGPAWPIWRTPSTGDPAKSPFEPAADLAGPINCEQCMVVNAEKGDKEGRGKQDGQDGQDEAQGC